MVYYLIGHESVFYLIPKSYSNISYKYLISQLSFEFVVITYLFSQ